ncbi:MAG: hypothetical protein HQK74_03120 [Desulfamplus sp.]|nr:hypothetical protein [Desulfamplus sp.]
MFFVYFLFAFICAVFVYIDSAKEQMPRWWAAVIFFAPITMIYYIVITKQRKSLIPVAIFVLISVFVGIGEYFLYSRLKDKIMYASYSEDIKEILVFTDDLKYSVTQLNDLTLELEDMQGINSSPTKIGEVITLISKMQSALKKHDSSVKKFLAQMDTYQDSIIDNRFYWLFKLQEYYTEQVVVRYLSNFALYLESFSSLSKYTRDNFIEIETRVPVYIKNYDEYYMQYIRILDTQNLVDVGRMRFQHNFVLHNAQLKPYLPVILQKRFINIWRQDK